MFYTYILKSIKNNSYYIGSCKNTEVRFQQHNKCLVKSTKRYAPWTIIHIENFQTLKESLKRERQIKSWKSRSAIENLMKID